MITPFQEFIQDQKTASVVLVVCTILALVIANSAWSHKYNALLETPLGIVFGQSTISMDVRHWINEGLMTFFFFLLGIEIKREILVGEIKSARRLAPIFAAATGGMLVPALVFMLFNAGTAFAHGWGIPMATDTAFAVGILALAGRHIPRSAFTFLAALAILDDLGAILVIALFYSETINIPDLYISLLILALLIIFNIIGIRKPSIYLLTGLIMWAAMLDSGIHATITGILVAATVPARPKRESHWFIQTASNLMSRFEHIENKKDNTSPILGEEEQHVVVESVQDAAEKATTPLRRWERTLEHPVSLFVMPIFALANAGISIELNALPVVLSEPLAIGIILGLLVGNGLGIPLFTYLALRTNLGQLPSDIDMRHVTGLGLLGGMGFTMSIFISNLGFENTPETLIIAKTAILLASLIAGISGYLWLRIRN